LTREEFERKIGKVTRELRLKKNLTQEQAADRCGCSLEQWKRYEMKGFLSIRVLLKIAVSLDDSLSPVFKLLERKFPQHELSTIVIGGFQDHVERDMNLQEIESYLHNEDRLWVKEKLQALAWLAQGMKVNEVRKRLGRSGGLIRQWLGRYYKSGIGWVLKSSKVAPPRETSEVWKE